LLSQEWQRQTTTLQLIASENFASPPCSPRPVRYSRTSTPRATRDVATTAATRSSTKWRTGASSPHALFGADHANVQPHSGANANVAVYQALLEPGDTILAMRLDQGGHLTHGSPASITSKWWNFVSYGVTPRSDDPENPGEMIDFDNVRELALEHRPKMILAGATAYSRLIDPAPFREIADEIGALLMFDSAHVAGLIAGGSHPNPVPYADVVAFTTHKTLRVRAAARSSVERSTPRRSIRPSSRSTGRTARTRDRRQAVSFKEAALPSFATYTEQIVANAKAFGAALAKEGFRNVSAEPRTTWCSWTARVRRGVDRKLAQEVLDRAGITTNRNTIPTTRAVRSSRRDSAWAAPRKRRPA